MRDLLAAEGTWRDTTGSNRTTVQDLAIVLKVAWDYVVRKKDENAERERRDQATMQATEEVAGSVPHPPVPILPPTQTTRVPLVPHAPVILN